MSDSDLSHVIERCKECGWALVWAVHFSELDEQGRQRRGVRADRVPHPRLICEDNQRLAREEWPVLPF